MRVLIDDGPGKTRRDGELEITTDPLGRMQITIDGRTAALTDDAADELMRTLCDWFDVEVIPTSIVTP